ncbi:Fungal Zn2-Cys6 binuclear cluster domain-containing protein [Cladophialophora immunda]|nr:Fungal Zn2-Cys6 binuclear cluster domain-containing protein [Cladophialophora immunda]
MRNSIEHPSISDNIHPPSRKRKLRYTRTRTGCLTCRRRRKKCDEKRPFCIGCSRNSLACCWPDDLSSDVQDLEERGDLLTASWDSTQVSYHGLSPTSIRVDSSDSDAPTLPALPISHATGLELLEETTDRWDPAVVGRRLVWSPLNESLSSLTSAPRLKPTSPQLLRHYIERTADFLAVKQQRDNPFVTLVLPLAYCDELLMHSVLALSGSHICGSEPSLLEIQQATWQHYDMTLTGLRLELQNHIPMSHSRSLRLLLVLIMLCHFEAISGNREGSMIHHLRASRHLALRITDSNLGNGCKDQKDLQGFALEVYAYLALTATIAPYSQSDNLKVPFDSFVTSLSHLQQYDTFGTFFSCGYDLFEKIPAISLLFARRLCEKQEHRDCSEETTSIYEELLTEIQNWESCPPVSEMSAWAVEHAQTGEAYRHALLIYLKAAMCGSSIDNPKIIGELQVHVDAILPLLDPIWRSPYKAIVIWPSVIAGSCILRNDQQDYLRSLFELSRSGMAHVKNALELLDWLWTDPDRRAYGPFGLHVVMQQRGVNFCLT